MHMLDYFGYSTRLNNHIYAIGIHSSCMVKYVYQLSTGGRTLNA